MKISVIKILLVALYSHQLANARSQADLEDALTKFSEHDYIDPGNPPFLPNEIPPANQSVYFSVMNKQTQYTEFTKWALNWPSTKLGGFFTSKPTAEAKKILAKITKNDVASCQASFCCKFLADAMYGISKVALAGISPNCIYSLSALINLGGDHSVRMIELLPDDVLKAQGAIIMSNLGPRYLSSLQPDTIGKLLTNPTACMAITKETWRVILSKSDFSKKITSQCAHAGMKKLLRADGQGIKLARIATESFTKCKNKFKENLAKTLSLEQVSNFGKNMDNGANPGGSLPLEELTSNNAGGLTLRLILGYLYANPSRHLSMSKDAWRKVSPEIFDNLPVEDVARIAAALNSPDEEDETHFQSYLSNQQLTSLVNHSQICSILRPVAVKRNLAISTACFRSMMPATQSAVLVIGGPLTEDVLASIKSTEAAQWEYKDSQGLAVLTLASKAHPNLPDIIYQLGSSIDYDHPCSLIDSFEALKLLPLLQEHMSMKCFQKMAFTLESDQYSQLKPRLSYLIPLSELKRTRPAKFWTEMTPEVLGHLASSGSFCSQVDMETFTSINRKAYSTIEAKCFHQLRFINELPADAVHAIPPLALVKETSTSVTPKFLAMLTPMQLSLIGSDCGDEAGVAPLFTAAIFDAFSLEHFGRVTSRQWKHSKAEVFAAFTTAERLAAVPPEAMDHWTLSQVKVIPKDVLARLSAAQAEKISIAITDVKESALAGLVDITFNEDVQVIVDRRIKDAGIDRLGLASSALSVILIVAAVAAVIAVIGVGVYFWIRRNN